MGLVDIGNQLGEATSSISQRLLRHRQRYRQFCLATAPPRRQVVLRLRYGGCVETISHREMRNRSGTYLRRVAAGESFLVSNNGTVVAILGPPDVMSGIDVARGRGQSRPALSTAGRFSAIPRNASSLSSAEIVADTRDRW